MIQAKIYAVLAAIGLGLLAALKVVTMQRDAAKVDAKRAKKHMTEVKDIRKAEKEIAAEVKVIKKKAVEDIKNGKVPDNIRDRNNF